MTKQASGNLTARADIALAFAHIANGGADTGPPPADPIVAMRRFVDGYGAIEPRPPLAGVEVRPVQADGVPAEWIIPDQITDDARLVYLHGGGWVSGSFKSHRSIIAALAQAAGMAVLLVEYRLAPEHAFPAGLQDCETALAWAARNGPDGASPASRLFLAGDSAGANLSAVVCRQAIINGARAPDRVVLLSAVLDAALNPARGNKAHLDANAAGLEFVTAQYLQGAIGVDDVRVSPINIPDTELAAFPPCLLQVSSAEYLLWDSEEFARRVANAGGRAVLSVWPSMPHVWHAFLDLLPEARQALQEVADFLRAELSADPAT